MGFESPIATWLMLKQPVVGELDFFKKYHTINVIIIIYKKHGGRRDSLI